MAAPTITGIEVKAKFFPLAFLLFFCTPVIEIDGTPHRRGWGTHFFEVSPGRHTVKVYFRYLFMSQCGANSVAVDVQPGRPSGVSFYMLPWMFAKGIMKVTA